MTTREAEIQRRTTLSETRVAKAVFPPTTNHHDTLFGGTALAWMDEVSFITATRFCRKPLVTVSTDRKVQVEVFVEGMLAEGRERAINGAFSFVAVDDEGKPTPVLPGFAA